MKVIVIVYLPVELLFAWIVRFGYFDCQGG